MVLFITLISFISRCKLKTLREEERVGGVAIGRGHGSDRKAVRFGFDFANEQSGRGLSITWRLFLSEFDIS